MAKQQKEIIVPDGILAERIYRLRDQNVMLNRDLADLWGRSNKTKRAGA